MKSPPPSQRRQKRIRSRRALLSRIAQLFLVIGCLGAFLGSLVVVVSFFSSPPSIREKQLFMGLTYLGISAGAILFWWVAAKVQSYIANRGSRAGHKVKKHTAARNKAARRRTQEMVHREGAALVLTLIILALVSGILLQTQLRARSSHRLAEAALTRARLEQAATDAIRHHLLRIANDPTPEFDDAHEPWMQAREILDPSGISVKTVVEDQQTFFDINNLSLEPGTGIRSPEDILIDLMTMSGVFTAVEQVDALNDWMDPDDTGIYETFHYGQKPNPYAPANRLLYSLHETLHVEGFSPEQFQQPRHTLPGDPFSANLVDLVTVLPVERKGPIPVNMNTASRTVLLAIAGLENEAAVDTLLSLRGQNAVTSMDTAAMAVDPVVLSKVRPYLDVATHYIRVNASAFLKDQSLVVSALVERNEQGQVHILQWVL